MGMKRTVEQREAREKNKLKAVFFKRSGQGLEGISAIKGGFDWISINFRVCVFLKWSVTAFKSE